MSNHAYRLSQTTSTPHLPEATAPPAALADPPAAPAPYAGHQPALPSASIVIPTYNEAAHIERVVRGFMQSSYPHLIEILIVDGGSTDTTRDLVAHLNQEDPRVRLLDNPLKIQSAGLNIGIAAMQGEVCLRADGHSDYAPDYVERCVETLLATGKLNVGGVQRFVAANAFQAGVALATRSVLGNGGSRHRQPDYNGHSDTVFLGCWWKKDLERLDRSGLRETLYPANSAENCYVQSYFDLEQVTNQDSELNMRLRKLDPQGIYVSSAIKAWYYPRSTWQGLRKQYFKYGRGRCRTSHRHPELSPARAKLPLIAAIGALLLGLFDLFVLRGRLHSRKLFLLAASLPFLESLRVTLKDDASFARELWRGPEQEMPSRLVRWWYCSIALWTMTPAYLAGYLYQLYRRKIRKIENW